MKMGLKSLLRMFTSLVSIAMISMASRCKPGPAPDPPTPPQKRPERVCDISNLKPGWVITSMESKVGACGVDPPGTKAEYYIVDISQEPNQKVVRVCMPATLPKGNIPDGWYVASVQQGGSANPACDGSFVYTIKRVDGEPIGTRVETCRDDIVPSGWFIKRQRSVPMSECGLVGTTPGTVYIYTLEKR